MLDRIYQNSASIVYKYNLAKGATFGSINHIFLRVVYLRPQNRHPHLCNRFTKVILEKGLAG